MFVRLRALRPEKGGWTSRRPRERCRGRPDAAAERRHRPCQYRRLEPIGKEGDAERIRVGAVVIQQGLIVVVHEEGA